MSYLEIKNLQKKYTKDGPLVVNNMNLSIEKGEFIVFLGPSGCGKTTNLGNSRLHILRSCIGHGLDQDGISPTDNPVTDFYHFCMISIHNTLLL